MLDETDMSALPALTLMMDVSRSGTLVPTASNVSPITVGVRQIACPNIVAHHTMNYDTNIIARNDIKNDKKNKCSFSFKRESGMDTSRRRIGNSMS